MLAVEILAGSLFALGGAALFGLGRAVVRISERVARLEGDRRCDR